jgi:hypothetical protein
MTEPTPNTTRRQFLETTGAVATASTLAGVAVPAVHAAEDNTIRVALVGCGGRGTGAAGNALSTTQGPIKLVAMADVFEDRLTSSFDDLSKDHGKKGDFSKVSAVNPAWSEHYAAPSWSAGVWGRAVRGACPAPGAARDAPWS